MTDASSREPAEQGSTPHDLPDGPALPPVEAPSGAFIVQLFLIPLIIVGIIVTVWMGIGWLAHAETDPYRLADDLTRSSTESWQKAYTLSTILRSARYDHLKDDPKLCGILVRQLDKELDRDAGSEPDVQLRVYLCRAVGQFRLPAVFDPLLRAARRDGGQPYPVRLAAIEGLAMAWQNLGTPRSARRDEVASTLIEVTKEPIDGSAEHEINELHATAAYALGIVATPAAIERLVVLLDSGYPNTRYNAATGLAWLGRPEAVTTLLEMLDPDNRFLMVGELTRPDAARRADRDSVEAARRVLVMSAAIHAAPRLAKRLSDDDRRKLREALQRVVDRDDLTARLTLSAKEALALVDRR